MHPESRGFLPDLWWFFALMVIVLSALGCDTKAPGPSETAENRWSSQDWFEDVTRQVGLDFIHVAGDGARHFLPDQMGSGAAVFDYNGDDRLDVFLIQNGGPESPAKHRLYRQESDGTFRDASQGSGLDVAGYGMGAAVGDVDNDGRVDLLLTEFGRVRLFRNQGDETFADRTAESGLDNPRWGTSAAFFDYDRDGWLDLVVANYLDYNPTQACTDATGRPEFCGPHGFPGQATALFRNLGQGRFADTSVASGLARHPGPALGVICADFDGDGWPDIFLADDGRPNRLFINRQDGTFAEEAAVRGLAYTATGQTAGDMGLAWGDINGDGLFDLFGTHLAEEHHSLWVQGPLGLFQDRAAIHGLNMRHWSGTGFGTALADFDRDGDLDLLCVNGRVKRAAEPPPPSEGLAPFWSPYAQYHQIFINHDQGQFQDASSGSRSFCGTAMVGRGLACGDFNRDGALDVLVTGTGGAARLFYNRAASRGHWLMIRAVDPALGGRDAYGAQITVLAGGRRWQRLLQPAYSYLCSNDPRVHVGMGDLSSFDSINVLWPDGLLESFPGGATDRYLELRRGRGEKGVL